MTCRETPFLYELGPEGARKVLDDVQSAPIDVRRASSNRPGGTEALPTVLYVHGDGWVLGNAGTDDRLVRELAVGANVVVFVEYDRSPEAHYPVAN